jgi:all-trans-retinol 13,14-reductase
VKTERADVVVIGAGLGGLSAAGYLAKAGNRVLVLEHHAVPGGYAHEFRRGRFRFEVSLHALDGVAPGGWTHSVFQDLGVFDQVEFKRLDPYYTAIFPSHEIRAYLDPKRYEAELVRHFPHEAGGLRRLCLDMRVVFEQGRQWVAEKMINGPALADVAASFPRVVEAVGRTWSQYMAGYTEDPQLMAVLSVLWGYHGLPPSRLNAASSILSWGSYHLTGAYYPVGGSMAMSRAIEKTIHSYGGEIRYRQTVDRIEVRDGRAVAAETAQGLRVEAGMFVSNANPRDTLLKFVGAENLPPSYVDKVRSDLPSLSCLGVYLGLDRDLIAEGWPHHELLLFTTYDLDADYAASVTGDWDKVNMAITHYNHADPTCAPKGGSVIVLLALADWDYAGQWGTHGDLTNYGNNPRYLALKNSAAQKMIDRAAVQIPGLRESIKYMEVATPLTNLRYTRNSNGSIYGSVPTVNNISVGRLPERTPISNLLLTGAWVSNGGMSTALLSGASTALKACDLLAEGVRTNGPCRAGKNWTAPSADDPYTALGDLSHDEIAALLARELAGAQEQFR